MSSAFVNNAPVFYTLYEGNDRENGLGTYLAGSGVITRDHIFENLIDGVYANPATSNMSLSGSAIVVVSPTTQGLTKHLSMWKNLVGSTAWNPAEGYTAPSMATLAGAIKVPSFDPATDQELGVTFNLNTDIAVGTDMVPHIMWSPSTSSAGNVRWGIEYVVAERDTGIFTSSTIIHLDQDGSSTANANLSAEFTDAIVAASPNAVVQCRVFRNASHINDTYPDPAYLHSVKLHYLSNAVGTPRKDPDYYSWA